MGCNESASPTLRGMSWQICLVTAQNMICINVSRQAFKKKQEVIEIIIVLNQENITKCFSGVHTQNN